MKPLNSLTKRNLLAARKFDAGYVRASADRFFDEERYGEAFDFYLKLDDTEAIKKVKARAVEWGDPELLWRIEHARPARVTREDWARCGESAVRLGKHRSAAYVFQRLGDTVRQEAAEKEFKPPAAVPQPPAEPPPR